MLTVVGNCLMISKACLTKIGNWMKHMAWVMEKRQITSS